MWRSAVSEYTYSVTGHLRGTERRPAVSGYADCRQDGAGSGELVVVTLPKPVVAGGARQIRQRSGRTAGCLFLTAPPENVPSLAVR
jgi:hypothetical protein